MELSKRLYNLLASSNELKFDDSSKFIIMSDCHRGDGNWNDNFAQNKNIFYAALNYYYKNNYTYVELGDGDELWENRDLRKIINMYNDIFVLMAKFYKNNRLYMLYGNHDIEKKDSNIIDCYLREYYDENKKEYIPLFPHIKMHEGLVLKYIDTNDKILLIHGHQDDLLNDYLWHLARFLVRYFWKPLELIGIKDPTSTSINDKKRLLIETKFINWSKNNNQMIIAGHTHRPVMPEVGEHLYLNDGCCTKHKYITGIEICDGNISLVKWSIKPKEDRTLFVDREILRGPFKLKDYFNSIKVLK